MSCCNDSQNKDRVVFWIVLGVQVLALILVCFGVLPRELVLVSSGLVMFYLIVSPIESGLILFIASIPIFVAMPISENFDSLSAGRVFVLILFLKWFFSKKQIKFKKVEILSVLLLLVMLLSILPAVDKITAIKKVIYLVNLVVLVIVVKDTVKDGVVFKKISKAILVSGGIVFLIALGQLIFVYFSTIGGFWDWWADHVSYNFYGENLQQIVKTNNAWFASSPSSSSVLRIFGSFTDPHSFSLYLLLIIPFIFVFAMPLIKNKVREGKISKQQIFWLVWLILSMFFIVLSGTRGVWLSVVFAILASIYLLIKKMNFNRIVSCVVVVVIIFILLIPIASVFTAIPQFKERNNNDASLVLKRLASILNLDETSNQGRVYIWKKSLESFKKHPLLGIGVGNFPVVLEQDIALAKAGSSAHNLYLNFLVENGIFAFILIILIVLEILSTIFSVLKTNPSPEKRKLITAIFVFLVWIFGYGLFDIALMDERVFLLFLTILGLIFAIRRNPKILENE
ncbi:MAG: O-antigen ligase family protein [Candidatus Portnoybacteria bacterium]|nr:O-antigen ligase family protein [Candidatus Portnoybacteria bacterium]